MKKISNYVLLIFSFFLFLSCESPVEDAVLPYEKRLVVHGYLSPNQGVNFIEVDQNFPVLGPNNETKDRVKINNLKVSITNLAGLVVLGELDLAISSNYRFNFPASRLKINKGDTYFLNISADGFPSVKSQCTVPTNTINFKNTSLSSKIIKKEFFSDQLLINILVSGNVDSENYFAYDGEILFYNNSRPTTKSTFETSYITKEEIEAQKIQFKTGWYASGNDTHLFNFNISTLDENIYKYAKSVQNTYFNDDNPFAEPVQVYTNIVGGIGVFGAFIKSPQRTFELK